MADMVTLMHHTHTGDTWVDKKAEAIFKHCRAREQEMETQMTEESENPGEVFLIDVAKNNIYHEHVSTYKGSSKYGYHTPNDNGMQWSQSSRWAEMQAEVRAQKETIEQLQASQQKFQASQQNLQSSQVNIQFWQQIMQNVHPNVVPPSQRPRNTDGSMNTDLDFTVP